MRPGLYRRGWEVWKDVGVPAWMHTSVLNTRILPIYTFRRRFLFHCYVWPVHDRPVAARRLDEEVKHLQAEVQKREVQNSSSIVCYKKETNRLGQIMCQVAFRLATRRCMSGCCWLTNISNAGPVGLLLCLRRWPLTHGNPRRKKQFQHRKNPS